MKKRLFECRSLEIRLALKPGRGCFLLLSMCFVTLLSSKLPGWAKLGQPKHALLRVKGCAVAKKDALKKDFALKVPGINHQRACAQNNPTGDIFSLCTVAIVSLLASSSVILSPAKAGLPGFVFTALAPACLSGNILCLLLCCAGSCSV